MPENNVPEIRILNFDDSILKQKKLLHRYAHTIVDLREIGPRVRYYSSACARDAVERSLSDSAKNAITFLGSGDFHHISEVLISQFEQPLSVIMFDFHPDWFMSPRYGCGSWVSEVLRKKKNVLRFIQLGVSSGDLSGFEMNSAYLAPLKNDRLQIYPYSHSPSRTLFKQVPDNTSFAVIRNLCLNTVYWQELKNVDLPVFFSGLLEQLPAKDVYISIDKDCLGNDHALTNWEEGLFSLDELLLMLRLIKEKAHVVGVDITGDYSPVLVKGLRRRAASYFDHPKGIKASKLSGSEVSAINEETNLRILEVL